MQEGSQKAWSGTGLLLAELSRTELQGFIIHQICRPDSDFKPALGRSYYATLCHLIPEFIWADRPFVLDYDGTEMMFGQGSWNPYSNSVTYVFGMPGEALINFGLLGGPLAFLVWTFVVARARKWIYTWDCNDVRLFLAPWLSCLCIVLFMSDSPNMLFFTAKFAGVPLLLLWLSSNHLPYRRVYPARPDGVYARG